MPGPQDALGAHKMAGVREAIQSRGARRLYLPPDSPDLNPLEPAFAKLKTLLRTAAQRTVEALWHALGRALDAFRPDAPTTSPTPARFRLTGQRCRSPRQRWTSFACLGLGDAARPRAIADVKPERHVRTR